MSTVASPLTSLNPPPKRIRNQPRKLLRFSDRPDVMTRAERDAMVLEHMPHARRIARMLLAKYRLQRDELDDLVQVGIMFALESTPKYWKRDAGQPFRVAFFLAVRAGIHKHVRLRWAKSRGGSGSDAKPGDPDGIWTGSLYFAKDDDSLTYAQTLVARGLRPDEIAEAREEAALAGVADARLAIAA